jgi:hypothetical protein
LFCWLVSAEPGGDRVLACDPFLLADLPRYATPGESLFAYMERLALAHRCDWIEIVTPAEGDRPDYSRERCAATLSRRGFAPEQVTWRKRPDFLGGT